MARSGSGLTLSSLSPEKVILASPWSALSILASYWSILSILASHWSGYSWRDINIGDLAEVLRYPGFYKLGWKYLGYGLDQMAGSLVIR